VNRQDAEADAPIFVFHEAPFFVTDLFPQLLICGLGAIPILGLPIHALLNLDQGPPDMPVVLAWLVLVVLLGWAGAVPALTTVQRHLRGQKAGLRIGEGEDHVEVAFFSGSEVCRVDRFAYADITGCGTDRFAVDATGGYETLPYVATRGIVRDSVKNPIFLRVRQDARRLSPFCSHAIAADLDRVIRRHCDLPLPEKSLSAIAEEKTREMWRHVEAQRTAIRREAELRKKRFLRVDWVRLAMALAAAAVLKLWFLDEVFRVPFLATSDIVLILAEIAVCYRLVGPPLAAWRQRG